MEEALLVVVLRVVLARFLFHRNSGHVGQRTIQVRSLPVKSKTEVLPVGESEKVLVLDSAPHVNQSSFAVAYSGKIGIRDWRLEVGGPAVGAVGADTVWKEVERNTVWRDFCQVRSFQWIREDVDCYAGDYGISGLMTDIDECEHVAWDAALFKMLKWGGLNNYLRLQRYVSEKNEQSSEYGNEPIGYRLSKWQMATSILYPVQKYLALFFVVCWLWMIGAAGGRTIGRAFGFVIGWVFITAAFVLFVGGHYLEAPFSRFLPFLVPRSSRESGIGE